MCLVNLVRLDDSLVRTMSNGGSFFSRRKVSPDSLFEQELKVQVKSVEHVHNQWSELNLSIRFKHLSPLSVQLIESVPQRRWRMELVGLERASGSS